jgi:large subunit ribosomal protein L4
MTKIKAKLYDQTGKEKGDFELPAGLFGVEVKPAFVHEVLVSQESTARQPLAHTKTRGEVRGGGKKPWRQKGTGRARHGSIRSPLWSGGGVTFGPRNDRNFTKKINRKSKKLAFAMSLSDKAADEKVLVLEGYGIQNGKTKELTTLIGKLPAQGKLLLVNAGRNDLLTRSVKNLQKVRLAGVSDVNLKQVLDADWVLATPEAVEKLNATFGAKQK